MSKTDVSPFDRSLAGICEMCPICRHARRSGQGIAFAIVKNVETSLCPFCKAYERVHGMKAHEKRDEP